jgi:hypothetical protein
MTTLASASARMLRKDSFNAMDIYVGGDGKEIGIWQWQGCGYGDCTGKAMARG